MRQLETLAAGLKADSLEGPLAGMSRSTGFDPLRTLVVSAGAVKLRSAGGTQCG